MRNNCDLKFPKHTKESGSLVKEALVHMVTIGTSGLTAGECNADSQEVRAEALVHQGDSPRPQESCPGSSHSFSHLEPVKLGSPSGAVSGEVLSPLPFAISTMT